MKNITRLSALSATVFAAMLTTNAWAAEVQVQMLNGKDGKNYVFEPSIVRIKPGDSVKFIATDKGHMVQSISGMIPNGAKSFSGQIGQDTTVKFDIPGVYGYDCMPHYGMGMVGLVVVGTPTNKDAAKAAAEKAPGMAKQKFSELFTQLN